MEVKRMEMKRKEMKTPGMKNKYSILYYKMNVYINPLSHRAFPLACKIVWHLSKKKKAGRTAGKGGHPLFNHFFPISLLGAIFLYFLKECDNGK